MWIMMLSLMILLDAYISRQCSQRARSNIAAVGLPFQLVAAYVFIAGGEWGALTLSVGYSLFWAGEIYTYFSEDL
jgi:hypothetical protein